MRYKFGPDITLPAPKAPGGKDDVGVDLVNGPSLADGSATQAVFRIGAYDPTKQTAPVEVRVVAIPSGSPDNLTPAAIVADPATYPQTVVKPPVSTLGATFAAPFPVTPVGVPYVGKSILGYPD